MLPTRLPIVLASFALAAVPAANAQCLEQLIENPTPVEGAKFGTGVWLEGDTLVAGGAGGLSVFEREGHHWRFDHAIDLGGGRGPADWIDWTDFDGQRVITGGNNEAFIFARSEGRFVLEHKIESPDPTFRSFGETVAIEGDTAIAGQRGYFWVYRREADGWREVQFLDYPRELGLDRYGSWLELEEGWLMVSAHYTDVGGVDRAGAVVAFPQLPDGTFGEPQLLTAAEPREFEEISKPVVRGGTLVVTSRGEDASGGTQIVAHAFQLRGGSWVYDQAIRGSVTGDQYWSTATLSPDASLMLVGAPDAGGLYAFERDADGVYAEVARIDDGQDAGVLVGGLATDGRITYAGSPRLRIDEVSEVGAVAVIDVLCERCTADLNGDGRADVADLLAFLNLYELRDPAADFDGDGSITPADLDVFQVALDAGCPPLPTGCQPRLVETITEFGAIGDVIVEGDLAYAHTSGRGFVVLDVRDPTAPVELASLDANPDFSYIRRIEKLGDLVFFSGAEEKMVIADVSDPSAPVVLASFAPGLGYSPVASGDTLLLRSTYRYLAYDISDPARPSPTGRSVTAGSMVGGPDGFFLAGGYELMEGWMTAVDHDLQELSETELIGAGMAITRDNAEPIVYVASWNFRGQPPTGFFLTAIGVGDPTSPRVLGTVPGAGRFSLVERNGFLYAAEGASGVYVYDVRDPADMRLVHHLAFPARDVAIVGHYLWAFAQDGRLSVIDIATCLPCRADLDSDGRATVYDLLGFLNLYEAGDRSADFDQDGMIGVLDVLAFQRAVVAGCE